MTDQEERDAIVAAMERLLAGTPLRSSGNLDIISLAEEAGLKRNKLTHKHTDLKDRFYAERRANEGITDREAKLHKEIAPLKARIDELLEERDNYRTANEVFARALHALTVENATYDGAPAGHAQHTSQSSIPADTAQPTELSDPPERHLEPSRLQHPHNAITGNTAKFRGNSRARMCPMFASPARPAQRPRLEEIRSNLQDRISEAQLHGWLGEVEGLHVSLAGVKDKLTQIDTRDRLAVHLGTPSLPTNARPR